MGGGVKVTHKSAEINFDYMRNEVCPITKITHGEIKRECDAGLVAGILENAGIDSVFGLAYAQNPNDPGEGYSITLDGQGKPRVVHATNAVTNQYGDFADELNLERLPIVDDATSLFSEKRNKD